MYWDFHPLIEFPVDPMGREHADASAAFDLKLGLVVLVLGALAVGAVALIAG